MFLLKEKVGNRIALVSALPTKCVHFNGGCLTISYMSFFPEKDTLILSGTIGGVETGTLCISPKGSTLLGAHDLDVSFSVVQSDAQKLKATILKIIDFSKYDLKPTSTGIVRIEVSDYNELKKAIR